ITTCDVVKNFAGLLSDRLLLGVFEAGFLLWCRLLLYLLVLADRSCVGGLHYPQCPKPQGIAGWKHAQAKTTSKDFF
ncbi:hypothetical protein JMJ78_0000856, partial [Colletotrichum scovillei]